MCSDIEEHRKRVENRVTDINGLIFPNWNEVIGREYHQWEAETVKIDTVFRKPKESFIELLGKLNVA